LICNSDLTALHLFIDVRRASPRTTAGERGGEQARGAIYGARRRESAAQREGKPHQPQLQQPAGPSHTLCQRILFHGFTFGSMHW
jgi:hypothetical protein